MPSHTTTATHKNSESSLSKFWNPATATLDMSGASLTSWPASHSSTDAAILKSAKVIKAPGNRFEEFPKEILECENLRALILDINQIASIPASIARLKTLESLSLDSNSRLSELPGEMAELTNLKYLNISGNKFTRLPEFLWELEQLESLHIGGNQLDAIPPSLANLKNLKSLNLYSCKLSRLPDYIGEMTQLEELSLDFNELTELPDFMGQLKNLWMLSVEGNKLTRLPDFIGDFKQLESLYLALNQLTELPDAICRLDRLETLNISGNRLLRINPNIKNLKQLKRLEGHYDTFAINDCFEGLDNLRDLTLVSGEGVRPLPESLKCCKRLVRLVLRANDMRELPDWLGDMPSLYDLDVSINNLEKLPESLGNLKKLTLLMADHNPLKEIPWFILKMPSLAGISLHESTAALSAEEFERFSEACGNEGIALFTEETMGAVLSRPAYEELYATEFQSACDEEGGI